MTSLSGIIKSAAAVLMAAALCVAAMPTETFAEDWRVDLDRKGSITVGIKDNGTGQFIKGGTLALTKVADVVVDDGYKFVYTEEFSSFTDSLVEDSDLTPELAKKLSNAAKTTVATKEIGASGTAVFPDLGVGLYVITQTKAADGYKAVAPFLVTLPFKGESGLEYDVDASPKPEQAKEIPPTVTPPPRKTTPPPKRPPVLPQTGQLWWPVPALFACGLLFLLFGWRMRRAA